MSTPRVLYITNSHAAMYEWQGGTLLDPAVFAADEAGRDAFENYVKGDTRTVVSVLVDVIEEEFRNELVPHVVGRDHAILVARRAEQAFRLTPYRIAAVQGRRAAGKREDEVLLSGLTNPELVKPWLEILTERKVPVRGMYSVAQLAGDLLKQLKVDNKCALLITRQEYGGLRQSYFIDRKLKISRQSPTPTTDVVQYAEQVRAEVDKTQRYLTRLKLVDRDDVMHVHIVSNDAEADALRAVCRDSAYLQFHVHVSGKHLPVITPRAGKVQYGEPVYVHLLRKCAPKGDYSTPVERRYNTYRRARIGLYGLSAATLVTGMVWTGINTIDLQLLREYSSTANRLSDDMQERYARVLAEIPKTPVSPKDLRIGVDIANALISERALPQPILYALSGGLREFGNVRVRSIDWVPTRNPASVTLGRLPADQAAGTPDAPPEQTENTGDAPAAPSDKFQVALLHAEIKPFDGDYKKAFETVTRFVNALKRNVNITEAIAVDLPLNTRPSVTLQGKAGVKDQEFTATFSVRAVLKVKHDVL